MAPQQTDPALAELESLAGNKSASAEDPAIAELNNMAKPAASQYLRSLSVSRLVPSPITSEAREAATEEPMIDLGPGSKSEQLPHMVRGEFGEPEPPESIQQEQEKALKQYQLASTQDAVQKEQLELHPTAAAFTGPGTFLGTKIPGDTWKNLVEHPIDYAKNVLTKKNLLTLASKPPIEGSYAIPPSFSEQHPKAGAFLSHFLGGTSNLLTPDNLATVGTLSALPGAVGALAERSKALYAVADAAAAEQDWQRAADAINAARRIGMANNALRAVNFTVGTTFTGQFAMGLYKNQKDFRDAVNRGDWTSAAAIAGEAIPNMAFTAAGMKDLFEAGQRVKAGIESRSAAREAAENLRAEQARNVTPQPPAEFPQESAVPTEPPEAEAKKPEPGISPEAIEKLKQPVSDQARAEGLKAETQALTDRLATGAGTDVERRQAERRIAENAEMLREIGERRMGQRRTEPTAPVPAELRGTAPAAEEEPELTPAENIAAIRESTRKGEVPDYAAIAKLQPPEVPSAALPPTEEESKEITATGPKPARNAVSGTASYAGPKGIGRPVAAWRDPEIPGLAATQIGKKQWTVTHEGSGLKIGDIYPSAKSAFAAMRKLGPVADWTKDWTKAGTFHLADLKKAVDSALSGEPFAKPQRVEFPEGVGKMPTVKLESPTPEAELEQIARTSPSEILQSQKLSQDSEKLTGNVRESSETKPMQLPEGFEAYQKKTGSGRLGWNVKDSQGNEVLYGATTKDSAIKNALRMINTGEIEVPERSMQPEPQKERPIDREAEKSTVAAEEQPSGGAEPSREPRPELPGALGGRGEEPLEAVPSEAVRGAPEEREAARSGGESREADRGRSAERGEQRAGLPERVGGGEGEIPVPAERGRPAGPRSEPGQLTRGNSAGNDYRITDADAIGTGGLRTKYRDNIGAIRTLKAIEQEGRLATPEEQQTLAKYVGWGGLSQVFDENSSKRAAEREELKSLLTDDEYKAARASTPNAHYTSVPVVRAIWDAMRRLGFRDGRMLEPAAGVGNFLGLMPPDLSANTAKVAIELDPITGRILKQLYQTADARIQGFEKFNGRDGQFDIVVGNVPFGDYHVNDPQYNKLKLNIHNYFIVKSLDKLRPGGVAGLITSSYTMDSVDPKARKLFADRARLVGAIRLPNNAFKGNANTEVTTDILFFRKPMEDEQPLARASFDSLKKVDDLADGEPIPINEYFANNPEMMLGNMGRSGSMYRGGEPALIAPPEQELPAELTKAVARLPENVMTWKPPESTTTDAAIESIPDYKEVKQYGLAVKKSKVFRRIGDGLVALPDYPSKSLPVLKDMLGMRDAVRELFQAEGRDRPTPEQQDFRGRLNRLYDKFVQKNGILHNPKNERAMRADPDLPLLLSLENYDPKTKTAKKSDVFFKQTVAPRRPIEHVDTPKDAMLVSLSEKGRLDFEHMQKITGQTPEQLQTELKSEGLIFHNPEGHWETTDAYLSGNVRKKLVEARDAAQRNPEFQDNVKALETVQPKDIEPANIEVRLGASWIPRETIKEFLGHILGGPEWERRSEVQHIGTMGLWSVNTPYVLQNTNATLKWGTARANAVHLIEQGLNLRQPVVYDPGEGDKPVVNQEQTLLAQEKLERLNEEFKRWLFTDSRRANEYPKMYNDQFNSEVERKWDGSHLTLPGSSAGIKLRPHQKNSIWRNINGGNQLLAHEVGTGKSFIMVGTAMEMRRLGLAKKPLIVVPKHIVEQISRDFRRLYPEANVLMADEKSFSAENRKEFTSRIATGDWDAVVMGHTQFGLLGVDDETFKDFANEQIASARAMMEEVAREEGKRGPTVKQIEKDVKRWEAKIEERAAREVKDNTINFETLGIDALMADEAHYFKRLWFPTKLGRVPGIPNGDSKRAMDMYLKARYVSRLNNGRNVIFATGTPISNTMAEMFVMMKYLDEDNLKALGLEHFDSWAANFGQQVSKLEVRPEDPSRMRIHSRFAKFVNVPELTKMFRRTADVRTAEEAEIPRPKLIGGRAQNVIAQPSEKLIDYIAKLAARADAIRGRRVEKGGDNMLNITTDGRKAATDYRLIDPGSDDDPGSKVNKAVERIAQIYHDKAESLATQLVMLDLGVPTEEGKREGRFNLYQDIKRKLVGRGIPENEIQFIQDMKKDEQKQDLFNRMNDGQVRVLLGSTPLVGVGTNIQKRLYAIHHLDAPLRPSDIEQRNGRILRQGNTNPEVAEYRYITERTFDAYIWQLLENKARFIAQVMKGDPMAREMEDADDFALSAAEVKALATGNPLVMQKVETDTALAKLYRLAGAHANEQFNNNVRLARIPEEIDATQQSINDYKADVERRDANKSEKFIMSVGKNSFDERKDAGAALNEAMTKNAGVEPRRVGQFGGFDLYVRGNFDGYLLGKRSHYFTGNTENPLGTIQSVESTLRHMDGRVEERQNRMAELQKEQKQRQAEEGKPFEKIAELRKLEKKKEEIDKKLDTKNRDSGPDTTAKDDREDGEAGFATIDMLTLGLPSLYRKIMSVWKRLRQPEEGQTAGEPPESREPAGVRPVASGEEAGVPLEPPGEEPTEKSDKAINIRLDKLNTSEDVKNLIRQTARDNAARIHFQRRARLADKELQSRMAGVDLDAEKLGKLKRGAALNEAEMQVAIGIMIDKAEQVKEASRAAQKDNSANNILRAQQLHNEYVAIQAAVSGAKAESGRALRIQRMISDAFKTNNISNYERVIEALGGRPLTEKEAQKLLEIKEDDLIGYHKFLQNHGKFSTMDKLLGYWMNSLLSSPRTMIRKMMGDATMVALNVPTTFARAAIDPFVAKMTRRKREFYFRDAYRQNMAFIGAWRKGLERAAFILKNGFELEDAEELGLPMRYQLPGVPERIAGERVQNVSKALVNYPTRELAAATAAFRIMHYNSLLAASAVREGIKQGLDGKALRDRAAELYDNPTPEMVADAMKEARRLAFIEAPGPMMRQFLKLRKTKVGPNIAPLEFLFPFVSIEANMMKNAVRYSPLGVLSLKPGNVRTPQASDILARALVGSIMLVVFAEMAWNGLVTGSAGKSSAQRDSFYRSGRQPYSVKVGDRWVRYTGAWSSMAPALSAVAAWHDAYVENQKVPTEKQVSEAASAIGASALDQPLMGGIESLMTALQNPSGSRTDEFEAQTASGFIPFSSLLHTTAQSLDPEIRDPQTVYERVKAGLPILSRSIPPKLDILGQPDIREGGTGAEAFLPSPIPRAEPKNKVDAELVRLYDLGLPPVGFAGDKITIPKDVAAELGMHSPTIQLTHEEQRQYQKSRGQLLDTWLTKMIDDQDYRNMDDSDKVEFARELIARLERMSREQTAVTLVRKKYEAMQHRSVPQSAEVPMHP